MAKFTAVAGVDFKNFDIEDLGTGNPTDTTSTRYKLQADTNDFNEFFGTGFKYDAGNHLIAGTLNEITSTDGGELYDIGGLSMAVTTANKFILNKDANGFLAAVFAGADAITGSTVADTLLGFNGNDTIDGSDGKDSLSGGAGNDSLIGGKGDDTMDGGAGNDTYVVDSGADVAAESGVGGAGGIDTVQSSATAYTLGANIENLILTGTADINGTGNTLANVITGNTGKNVLSGDIGNDKLIGGDGADTLSGGDNNDTLDGGIGDDSLDGGAGDDSMAGGAGNDIYVVDSAKDKVTESLADDKGGGKDTVESSVSFTLGNNLDDLTLRASAGRIDATGNALDNALTGNDKDNKLSGLAGADTIVGGDGNDTLDGGIGPDSMAGGKGDDIYVLDVAVGNDTVTEAAGGGKDTVQAAFSIDLNDPAFANIENATLLGTAALSAKGTDIDGNFLTGNGGVNTLDGGGGNDTLDGGKGNDSLKGGAGDDLYGIDSAKDIVDETGGGNDTIQASISIALASYAGIENVVLLGTGALNATGTDGVANKLTGNAGANKLDGLGGDDTMDGGKGNDTYFVDSSSDKVSEDTLTGGGTDTVFSTASFTLSDNIENLTLLGAALIGTGNDGINAITGNDLANTLDGKGGIDKLVGGKGDDTYFVDNAKDVVTESTAGAPGGKDTVNSSDSFVLGANVENLNLTGNKNSSGTGNALDNAITGDGTSNTLLGLAGADKLDGGAGNDTLDGGAGIDDLTGGTGNDTYVLDNVKDVFHEGAGDSGDTVAAPFNIDLRDAKYDEIENATLLGAAALSAIGDDGNNYLTGNSGANTLTGGAGADTLDGKGGIDSLDGGEGSDVYYADNAGEKIYDTGLDAKEKDEVRASVTFSLGAFATIENAMLLGIAALNLTGNGSDNVLTGNDGANKIDGVDGNDSVAGGGGNDTLTGGPGSDTLAGGKGDDVYVADGGETILENDKEGIDTVQSALSYSIAAIANVENLTLTGTLGIGGTGNSGNNVITGNSNQNTLDGGAGADTMAGGMGNDTYTVDDIGDKVNEAANAGIDTVLSSLHDYTLPANVENLTLLGSGDINGAGNTLGNLITGNTGKNQLDGAAGNDTLAGGLGADTLNGGAGTDTYIYAAKDVQDFVHTGDTGGKGADHVSIIGAFDWDVQRDGNDLLIQALPDEAAADVDFDPNQAIKIVGQYAGAGIAFFQGDFGKDNNLFYGDNPNLTTVFTPSGLNGKDQGHNAEVVEGTDKADTVNGGGGQTDFLYGNDGNDRVNSQSAADEFAFLSGGKGDDTLTGAAGTDAFRGDEGDDIIDGGAGFDRVSYRLANGAVIVDLTQQGTPQLIGANQGSDTLISIEAASGSKFNDTLTGDGNANNLFGLDGNDTLTGGGGADFLEGGAGNDTLRASSLDDFAEAGYDDAKVGVIVNLTNGVQAGVAALTAQDGLGGIDTLINIAGVLGSDFGDKFFGGDADEFFQPGGGDDTIDGGAGFDDVDYFSSSDAVNASLIGQGNANLISASQGSDAFINIEGLEGSAFNDTLVGDHTDNFLQGRDGADSLFGFNGNDRLRGGAGNDTLDGADGFDVADYAFAIAAVHVDLNKQFQLQVISKDEGSDDLRNIEDLRGSDFNDTLIGNFADNFLTGSDGNDSLVGGGGFDSLAGGTGNDILNGGDGFDFADYSDAAASGGVTGVRVDLSKHGVAQVISTTEGSDVLIAIEAASGSQFNDTLIGDSAFNNLTGHDGDDLLQGGANQDFLVGGKGNDTLDGGVFGEFNEASFEDAPAGVIVNLSSKLQMGVDAGHAQDGFGTIDTLISIQGVFGSESNDTIFGGAGSEFFEGMGGNDSIVGGGGFDVLEYFSATQGGVTADLSQQGVAQFISTTQGTDTFTGISDIYGSFFHDSLKGDSTGNILWGRDGNDTLIGGGGADTLDGDVGDDQLVVADGSFSRAYGGFGTDRLVVAGANVTITESDVFNKLYNIEQIDLTGTGNNHLTLNALDVLQTSDNFIMQIMGDNGDSVTSLGQGWTPGPDSVLANGQACHTYTATVHVTQGTFPVTLMVDTEIAQTIT